MATCQKKNQLLASVLLSLGDNEDALKLINDKILEVKVENLSSSFGSGSKYLDKRMELQQMTFDLALSNPVYRAETVKSIERYALKNLNTSLDTTMNLWKFFEDFDIKSTNGWKLLDILEIDEKEFQSNAAIITKGLQDKAVFDYVYLKNKGTETSLMKIDSEDYKKSWFDTMSTSSKNTYIKKQSQSLVAKRKEYNKKNGTRMTMYQYVTDRLKVDYAPLNSTDGNLAHDFIRLNNIMNADLNVETYLDDLNALSVWGEVYVPNLSKALTAKELRAEFVNGLVYLTKLSQEEKINYLDEYATRLFAFKVNVNDKDALQRIRLYNTLGLKYENPLEISDILLQRERDANVLKKYNVFVRPEKASKIVTRLRNKVIKLIDSWKDGEFKLWKTTSKKDIVLDLKSTKKWVLSADMIKALDIIGLKGFSQDEIYRLGLFMWDTDAKAFENLLKVESLKPKSKRKGYKQQLNWITKELSKKIFDNIDAINKADSTLVSRALNNSVTSKEVSSKDNVIVVNFDFSDTWRGAMVEEANNYHTLNTGIKVKTINVKDVEELKTAIKDLLSNKENRQWKKIINKILLNSSASYTEDWVYAALMTVIDDTYKIDVVTPNISSQNYSFIAKDGQLSIWAANKNNIESLKREMSNTLGFDVVSTTTDDLIEYRNFIENVQWFEKWYDSAINELQRYGVRPETKGVKYIDRMYRIIEQLYDGVKIEMVDFDKELDNINQLDTDAIVSKFTDGRNLDLSALNKDIDENVLKKLYFQYEFSPSMEIKAQAEADLLSIMGYNTVLTDFSKEAKMQQALVNMVNDWYDLPTSFSAWVFTRQSDKPTKNFMEFFMVNNRDKLLLWVQNKSTTKQSKFAKTTVGRNEFLKENIDIEAAYEEIYDLMRWYYDRAEPMKFTTDYENLPTWVWTAYKNTNNSKYIKQLEQEEVGLPTRLKNTPQVIMAKINSVISKHLSQLDGLRSIEEVQNWDRELNSMLRAYDKLLEKDYWVTDKVMFAQKNYTFWEDIQEMKSNIRTNVTSIQERYSVIGKDLTKKSKSIEKASKSPTRPKDQYSILMDKGQVREVVWGRIITTTLDDIIEDRLGKIPKWFSDETDLAKKIYEQWGQWNLSSADKKKLLNAVYSIDSAMSSWPRGDFLDFFRRKNNPNNIDFFDNYNVVESFVTTKNGDKIFLPGTLRDNYIDGLTAVVDQRLKYDIFRDISKSIKDGTISDDAIDSIISKYATEYGAEDKIPELLDGFAVYSDINLNVPSKFTSAASDALVQTEDVTKMMNNMFPDAAITINWQKVPVNSLVKWEYSTKYYLDQWDFGIKVVGDNSLLDDVIDIGDPEFVKEMKDAIQPAELVDWVLQNQWMYSNTVFAQIEDMPIMRRGYEEHEKVLSYASVGAKINALWSKYDTSKIFSLFEEFSNKYGNKPIIGVQFPDWVKNSRSFVDVYWEAAQDAEIARWAFYYMHHMKDKARIPNFFSNDDFINEAMKNMDNAMWNIIDDHKDIIRKIETGELKWDEIKKRMDKNRSRLNAFGNSLEAWSPVSLALHWLTETERKRVLAQLNDVAEFERVFWEIPNKYKKKWHSLIYNGLINHGKLTNFLNENWWSRKFGRAGKIIFGVGRVTASLWSIYNVMQQVKSWEIMVTRWLKNIGEYYDTTSDALLKYNILQWVWLEYGDFNQIVRDSHKSGEGLWGFFKRFYESGLLGKFWEEFYRSPANFADMYYRPMIKAIAFDKSLKAIGFPDVNAFNRFMDDVTIPNSIKKEKLDTIQAKSADIYQEANFFPVGNYGVAPWMPEFIWLMAGKISYWSAANNVFLWIQWLINGLFWFKAGRWMAGINLLKRRLYWLVNIRKQSSSFDEFRDTISNTPEYELWLDNIATTMFAAKLRDRMTQSQLDGEEEPTPTDVILSLVWAVWDMFVLWQIFNSTYQGRIIEWILNGISAGWDLYEELISQWQDVSPSEQYELYIKGALAWLYKQAWQDFARGMNNTIKLIQNQIVNPWLNFEERFDLLKQSISGSMRYVADEALSNERYITPSYLTRYNWVTDWSLSLEKKLSEELSFKNKIYQVIGDPDLKDLAKMGTDDYWLWRWMWKNIWVVSKVVDIFKWTEYTTQQQRDSFTDVVVRDQFAKDYFGSNRINLDALSFEARTEVEDELIKQLDWTDARASINTQLKWLIKDWAVTNQDMANFLKGLWIDNNEEVNQMYNALLYTPQAQIKAVDAQIMLQSVIDRENVGGSFWLVRASLQNDIASAIKQAEKLNWKTKLEAGEKKAIQLNIIQRYMPSLIEVNRPWITEIVTKGIAYNNPEIFNALYDTVENKDWTKTSYLKDNMKQFAYNHLQQMRLIHDNQYNPRAMKNILAQGSVYGLSLAEQAVIFKDKLAYVDSMDIPNQDKMDYKTRLFQGNAEVIQNIKNIPNLDKNFQDNLIGTAYAHLLDILDSEESQAFMDSLTGDWQKSWGGWSWWLSFKPSSDLKKAIEAFKGITSTRPDTYNNNVKFTPAIQPIDYKVSNSAYNTADAIRQKLWVAKSTPTIKSIYNSEQFKTTWSVKPSKVKKFTYKPKSWTKKK